MPAAPKVIINAVPPWLIKSSGIPDNGIMPSMEAIFINDSMIISIAIPIAVSPPNMLGDLAPILKDLKRKRRKSKISTMLPTKPNSSACTAKMESPIGSGR